MTRTPHRETEFLAKTRFLWPKKMSRLAFIFVHDKKDLTPFSKCEKI
jgi:hypothetical protein